MGTHGPILLFLKKKQRKKAKFSCKNANLGKSDFTATQMKTSGAGEAWCSDPRSDTQAVRLWANHLASLDSVFLSVK